MVHVRMLITAWFLSLVCLWSVWRFLCQTGATACMCEHHMTCIMPSVCRSLFPSLPYSLVWVIAKKHVTYENTRKKVRVYIVGKIWFESRKLTSFSVFFLHNAQANCTCSVSPTLSIHSMASTVQPRLNGSETDERVWHTLCAAFNW